ncbi:MAG TPA: VWA domain-containing protein [Bacteroidales bacterium]|nr:VWA domain-containing protein [Bacteroidales bacterium]
MSKDIQMMKKASQAALPTFYQGETSPNAEMKCPVVLVLDRSSSMQGAPINELNRGLKIFQTQIQNDEVAAARLEVAIVTFASDVTVVRDFALFEQTGIETITADGDTDIAGGVQEAMQLIEARKAWYKGQGLQYYRPYIIIMTDGLPTSSQKDLEKMRSDISKGVSEKKFNVWAFGVEKADMKFLRSIVPGEFPPQKLKGTNFSEFFRWLSSSFSTITASRPDNKVDISPRQGENPFQITV